jgi:hypothetical protein
VIRTLYRPVGVKELQWITESGWQAFPPRFDWQPIFYPVDADYLAQFEEQVVGSTQHRELWIPAEELPNFNQHIQDEIRVLKPFYGEQFSNSPD